MKLYENLNFNFIRDIAPVASIGRDAFVMVVNPSFPAKTVLDLGGEPFASSPTDFGKFIVEYTEKWGKVIRAAGIKAEIRPVRRMMVFRARSLLYCSGHCKKSCAATSVEKDQQETCVRVKIKADWTS